MDRSTTGAGPWKIRLLALAFGAIAFPAFILTAGAQSVDAPQLLLTWEARNLYPAAYPAKAFPSQGSTIDLSMSAISRGSLMDLSNAVITWRVDERVIGRSAGLQIISFTSSKQSGSSHFVRAIVETGGNEYEIVTRIPVLDPRVVIQAETSAQSVQLSAVPFFFNASNLSGLNFTWTVAGKTFTKDGDGSVSIGAEDGLVGSGLRADLTVRNLANPLEFAKAWLSL